MKFKQYLNERYDDYEDDDTDHIDTSHADGALKAYIKDPSNKHWLIDYADELLDLYGNSTPLKLYRGLNFDTKEDYDKFINSISDGKIKIVNNASSWTRSISTARQFAKTKPSYMEFMSSEKMKLISKAQKEREYVVGYRGVILEIDINKGEGVDTKETPFAAEDEVIIFKGEYKCKYHELKKNSDRIKEEGLDALLDEIEKAQESDDKRTENYNETLLQKIIHDHRDELTDKMKAFFGRRFLKKVPGFGYGHTFKNLYSRKNDKLEITLAKSPIITYGEDLFNKEDVKKYLADSYKEHKKMLEKIKKEIDKSSDDYNIEWYAHEPSKWFKLIGLSKEFESLFSKYGKKYHDLNSKDNVKRINGLKGKDRENAIDDFANSLKDLIKSMGAK